MKILILGATGFIGSKLCEFLYRNYNYTLIAISRNKFNASKLLGESVQIIEANPSEKGEWLNIIDESDAVINLAGEPLTSKRLTDKQKNLIYLSRIATTKNIVEHINETKTKPKVLINASAIGYYGKIEGSKDKDIILDEYSPPLTNNFISNLVRDWETAAQNVVDNITRVVILRFGAVLGHGGGMLQAMLPTFSKGLGGPLGDGSQWLSWVHIDDVIQVITNSLNDPKYKGIFNVVTPNAVTNLQFTKALAAVLQKPAIIPVPKIVLKLLYGEELTEDVILASLMVYPQRLINIGYEFKFSTIEKALVSLFSST